MFKQVLIVAITALALLCITSAYAAPTLTSDPYATGVIDAASVTINGGSPITCTLPAASGNVTPTCNLATITAPGTYTLVLTVAKAYSCTNTANSATCTAAGTASSAPFSYTWKGNAVSSPSLNFAQ